MAQYILDDAFFYKCWFAFDVILAWGWIIDLLYQLYRIATFTFDNYIISWEKERSSFWLERFIKNNMLNCLDSRHYTFHGNDWYFCLQSIMLFFSSGILCIMMLAITRQWRPVITLQVYLLGDFIVSFDCSLWLALMIRWSVYIKIVY